MTAAAGGAAHPAIIFDVGNVLIRWDPALVHPDHSPQARDAFFAEIDFPAWNLEQDRGRDWDAAVAEASARHPRRAALIARFHHRWRDSVPGEVPGAPAILRALHAAGAPLFAITNFSAAKWAETRDRFAFLRLFRDVTVSAHERLAKPDPEIHRRCLARNGLPAAGALFIDDSPPNVAAAAALGLDAIRFTDAPALAAALRVRGLPLPSDILPETFA